MYNNLVAQVCAKNTRHPPLLGGDGVSSSISGPFPEAWEFKGSTVV